MSYVKYNGQYVKSGGSFLSSNIINYVLADFNDDNITWPASNFSSLEGDSKMSFKLYMDIDSGFNNTIFNFKATNSDWFALTMLDSSMYVSVGTGSPVYWTSYEFLSEYKETILNCEITKNMPTSTYPTNFKINGDTLSGINGSGWYNRVTNNGIGYGLEEPTSGSDPVDKMGNGTIWDIRFTDLDPKSDIAFYKGYGNTLAAWEDQIGSADVIQIGAGVGTRPAPSGFVPS